VTPPQQRSSKRQRQITPDQMPTSTFTQRSNVSSIALEQKKNKTLQAMLGLSDDDDDDEPAIPSINTQISVVPDSQPPEPVPEPEPERRMTRTRAQAQAQKNVDTRSRVNKNVSLLETQVSVVDDEEDIDVIPASPELFTDQDPVPVSKPNRRNAKTAEASAKRKQPEEPVEVIHDSQEPGSSTGTKKRRVDVDDQKPDLKEGPDSEVKTGHKVCDQGDNIIKPESEI